MIWSFVSADFIGTVVDKKSERNMGFLGIVLLYDVFCYILISRAYKKYSFYPSF